MELKKSFNISKIIIPLYVVCFLIYLVVGLLPAEALNYEIIGELNIPQINLTSDVADVKLNNHILKTPDSIVGSFSRSENKIFLFGHDSSVFKNLANLQIGDEIIYNSMIYHVKSIIVKDKSMISMSELLKAEDQKTLVLMTCAGDYLNNGDATHRLIVTATSE